MWGTHLLQRIGKIYWCTIGEVTDSLFRMMRYGCRQWLARFKNSIDVSPNWSFVAPISSFNCAMLVALAMGAVTVGHAISHATATCADVALSRFAPCSSASMMLKPRSFKYFFTKSPRALFSTSATDLYFACEKSARQRELAKDAQSVFYAHSFECSLVRLPPCFSHLRIIVSDSPPRLPRANLE